ncbi:hypothetical protein Vadar_009934 [Vaccinium darrowii]|uniref:Uncharacterized protein n=1 Tax=Vaccinium darrowii TaxID=229202 RepID=A0ACB7YLP4_9ERIC|nr:hypothetical protein Vadar_009934 [Vaccinium darrowii]
MLEVYNDKIRDLIENSDQPTKKLEVKQTAEGAQEVPGLVEACVFGTDEVWELLKSGRRARSVGSTNANELAKGVVGCGLEMSFNYCLSGDLLLKRRLTVETAMYKSVSEISSLLSSPPFVLLRFLSPIKLSGHGSSLFHTNTKHEKKAATRCLIECPTRDDEGETVKGSLKFEGDLSFWGWISQAARWLGQRELLKSFGVLARRRLSLTPA